MKQNSIYRVVRKQQCMSCGMCKSVCPTQAITLVYSTDGFFRPQIDAKSCVNCGKCLCSCPAEYQSNSPLLGEYGRLCLAHSCNGKIRHNATSGGVVNSLLRYLLDKGVVDAVLLTKYSEESVIEAEPVLLTKETSKSLEEQTRDFTSRYVIVPLLSEIKDYIKIYKKLAVVGTPCQIKALTLWLLEMDRTIVDWVSCLGGGGKRKRRYF